jgi:hypothetical protein
VEDGQDILTLSLGEVDGWTESSSSVVASRIAASGKVVTVAAGSNVERSSYSYCGGTDIDTRVHPDRGTLPVQEMVSM